MEETVSVSTPKHLSGRKKKKLYKRISEQMEFYFGDANLSKDRFLKKLIQEDPSGYVDLEVFKTFNKIKALTENVEVIATALSRSTFLEINAEKTKVRRVVPLGPPKENADDYILYIEKLPHYADLKWVRRICERFGPVDYVSMPRFKISNKHKGFAFVEFKSPEGVLEAHEFYKNLHADSPDEDALQIKVEEGEEEDNENNSEHAESSSTAQTSKHHEDADITEGELKPQTSSERNLKKRRKSPDCDICHDEASDDTTKEDVPAKQAKMEAISDTKPEDPAEKKSKKRKISPDCDNDSTGDDKNQEVISAKQPKIEEISDNDYETTTGMQQTEKKRKRDSSESERPTKKVKDGVEAPEEKQSKAEREQSNSQLHESNISTDAVNTEDETPHKSKKIKKRHRKKPCYCDALKLRVMPKTEWKVYRNKYLEVQRIVMSHLKKQIVFQTEEMNSHNDQGATPEKVPGSPQKNKTQFQPGVILKVVLTEPITNTVDIKDQVKRRVNVAYIDAPLGHSEMFVRCHSHENAASIFQNDTLNFLGTVQLLEGKEDEDYWQKIEDERKAKFSLPKTHKKRGRDKIIAKAMKLGEQKNRHIYFNEE